MSDQKLNNDAASDDGENPYDESGSTEPVGGNEMNSKSVGDEKSFEELSEESSVGIVREFIDFLKYNKKWWLTPIIAVLLLVGVLIILTTSGAAPFLYTFW